MSDIQYITAPNSTERLVVMTEENYVLLMQRSIGEAVQRALFTELPFDVRARIDGGDSPLTVLREWRGLTGRQLARVVGISASMVSQMERQGKLGSAKTLTKLAAALGVSLDTLVQLA